MPESDRARLVEFVGANPEAGGLIPETNLSKAEQNAMAKLVPALIRGYSKGRGAK